MRVPLIILQEKVVSNLVYSIKSCLFSNSNIKLLELSGFPLTEKCLEVLEKSLHGNRSLTTLSLARTSIADRGISILLRGLKNSVSLSHLNFSSCNLTYKSAILLSDLLKTHSVRQQSEDWSHTLRLYSKLESSKIEFVKKKGIKRLNLCCNNFGNRGCEILTETLREEVGLKVLELQYNNVSDSGGRLVEQMLFCNKEILNFDLRNNLVGPILMNKSSSLSPIDLPFEPLDKNDPLKETYINFNLNGKRHFHQTISSINKRVLLYQKTQSATSRNTRTCNENSSALKTGCKKSHQNFDSKTYNCAFSQISPIISEKKKESVDFNEDQLAVIPNVEWIHEDENFNIDINNLHKNNRRSFDNDVEQSKEDHTLIFNGPSENLKPFSSDLRYINKFHESNIEINSSKYRQSAHVGNGDNYSTATLQSYSKKNNESHLDNRDERKKIFVDQKKFNKYNLQKENLDDVLSDEDKIWRNIVIEKNLDTMENDLHSYKSSAWEDGDPYSKEILKSKYIQNNPEATEISRNHSLRLSELEISGKDEIREKEKLKGDTIEKRTKKKSKKVAKLSTNGEVDTLLDLFEISLGTFNLLLDKLEGQKIK
ncbi:Centrosomal protein of 78 kDa [Clydaea vesicula]|uniref:Centrosomal protein of 78 kDa n=1 Tax=Clydaea vesicula TaxID=447962 RepID=A0AAD5U372_9FUNG|nr:Centrosomal protein of 78 kDa [Clydaea vesicula]